MQEALTEAMGGRRGASAANSLCEACVGLLDVDAAALSLIFDGASSGTLGSSGTRAREYDEMQFVFGEGPCLDSVTSRMPVLVSDLADGGATRWPGYAPAMLDRDIHGVYAMPVRLAGEYVGALDLYRNRPSSLDPEHLVGALIAADLAEIPVLDLLAIDLQAMVGDEGHDAWRELAALTRVEISQATGMLIAQLDVDAGEALVRLRAYAYATNRSATDVAKDIVNNELRLEIDP